LYLQKVITSLADINGRTKPLNTKAQIHVPAKDINSISINKKTVDSMKNIKLIYPETNAQVFETIGGSYSIV